MLTPITTDWLAGLGFILHPDRPHGLSKDFGGGNLLQLVPHQVGWGVELWNGCEDSYCRAVFPRNIEWEQELLPVLLLMEPIPY